MNYRVSSSKGWGVFLAGNGVPGLGRHALRRAVYAVVCDGVRMLTAATGAARLEGWGSAVNQWVGRRVPAVAYFGCLSCSELKKILI